MVRIGEYPYIDNKGSLAVFLSKRLGISENIIYNYLIDFEKIKIGLINNDTRNE